MPAKVRHMKKNPNRLQQACPVTGAKNEDGVVLDTRAFEDVNQNWIGRRGVVTLVAKLYGITPDEVRDALDGYEAAKSLHEEAYERIAELETQITDMRDRVIEAVAP